MKNSLLLLASTWVAGAALLGCGGDTTPMTPGVTGPTTTGNPVTSAGATAGPAKAGSGGPATMPPSSAGGTPAKPTAGSNSTPLTPTTGGSLAPTAGTSPAATAGTVASVTGGASAGTAGAAGGATSGAAGGTSTAVMGSCGPENMASPVDVGDPKKPGPWMPKHVENTGPSGSSWIFYPDGLGMNGMKHPVFNWGPGAGTGPSEYTDHLNLLASQGFVIISQSSTSSGKAALDWILKENDKMGSMWYQKLDTARVSRGGHSMGALQSMSESMDPRLKLTVLVCGGASGSGGADNITYPSIFLGGEGEGGTTNFKGDYAQVKSMSIFITKKDTDHIYCARNNLAPWVAFMRWQLCGEEKWKKEFLPDGTYCKEPWLACMTKDLK
jgi:hypothetical protein